jgi:hypothetical protein
MIRCVPIPPSALRLAPVTSSSCFNHPKSRRLCAAALTSFCGMAAMLAALVPFAHSQTQSSLGKSITSKSNVSVTAGYGKLPMAFEPNRGQAAAQVRFLARGPNYSLALTDTGAVLSVRTQADCTKGARGSGVCLARRASQTAASRPATLQMSLAGALRSTPVAEDKLPGKVNYLIGNEPAHWHTGLPTYSRVVYKSVYPGIDLVYYGSQNQLEFDFLVAPGADPSQIRLALAGPQPLALGADGNLSFAAAVLHKPDVYQQDGAGHRRQVSGRFRLIAKNTVGFSLGAYDHSRPLIIDPTVAYSTFVGSTSTGVAWAIAVDSKGSAFITGQVGGAEPYPTTSGAYEPQPPSSDVPLMIFVSKLNPDGTALVYSTYLGGSDVQVGRAIALDGEDNAYVTGVTYSTDFPVTSGAFQTSSGSVTGGTAFVTKLNADGTSLVYSTFLGGPGTNSQGPVSSACGIAVDSSGSAYVTGTTTSQEFPVTSNAYQPTYPSAYGDLTVFVTKLNPAGTNLDYSTYLGGSGGAPNTNNYGYGDYAAGIALAMSGQAVVAGYTTSPNFPTTSAAYQKNLNGAIGTVNGFVTELDNDGDSLVFSTYLGGNGVDTIDALAVDASGSVYVTGYSGSPNFPLTAGAAEGPEAELQPTYGAGPENGDGQYNLRGGFVTKLSRDGSRLVYSTDLEGPGTSAAAIFVDGEGSAYLAGAQGWAASTLNGQWGGFQTTPDPIPQQAGGGSFLIKLNPDATVYEYASVFGPPVYAMAVDHEGNVYLTGQSEWTLYTTPGAFEPASPCTTGGRGCDDGPYVTKIAGAAQMHDNTAYPPVPTNIDTSIQGTAQINTACTGSSSAPLTETVTITFQADAFGPVPDRKKLTAAVRDNLPQGSGSWTYGGWNYPHANFLNFDGQAVWTYRASDASWPCSQPDTLVWQASFPGDDVYNPSSASGSANYTPASSSTSSPQ